MRPGPSGAESVLLAAGSTGPRGGLRDRRGLPGAPWRSSWEVVGVAACLPSAHCFPGQSLLHGPVAAGRLVDHAPGTGLTHTPARIGPARPGGRDNGHRIRRLSGHQVDHPAPQTSRTPTSARPGRPGARWASRSTAALRRDERLRELPRPVQNRRHGVTAQVVTDPGRQLLWLSPALPGRTHHLAAARTHRIIRICERRGVPLPRGDDRPVFSRSRPCASAPACRPASAYGGWPVRTGPRRR